MGVILYANNVSFEANAIAFIPPVAENLEYWGLFGGSVEKTIRNLAPGKGAGETIGVPVINQSFVTLSNANYLKTKALDSAGLSIVLVARFTEDGSNSALASTGGQGNRKSGALGLTSGIQFVRNAGAVALTGSDDIRATRYMFSGADNGATVSLQASRPVLAGQWAALSMVHSPATHTVTVTNLTTGQSVSTVAAAPNLTEDVSVAQILIGSQGLGIPGYVGSTDMAAAAIYSAALNASSLALVYDRLKKTMALRGINI
ncbi:hypothetical protein ACIPV9_10880 [Pseudomonas psychrophila]|uniref:hypothetical protein n=1 Tax=Pseudomonas psychrophila TaxID=122355 RepID=UPI00382C90F6